MIEMKDIWVIPCKKVSENIDPQVAIRWRQLNMASIFSCQLAEFLSRSQKLAEASQANCSKDVHISS